jgi:hypothetical protein
MLVAFISLHMYVYFSLLRLSCYVFNNGKKRIYLCFSLCTEIENKSRSIHSKINHRGHRIARPHHSCNSVDKSVLDRHRTRDRDALCTIDRVSSLFSLSIVDDHLRERNALQYASCRTFDPRSFRRSSDWLRRRRKAIPFHCCISLSN